MTTTNHTRYCNDKTYILFSQIIPACEALLSLTMDMWCVAEDADNVRLLHVTDIDTKSVVLSDLQPPPVCRFIKITVVGRYGVSSVRCRIPIGQFFGHMLVLDHDGYADPIMKYIRQKSNNLTGQLRSLNALAEDVQCRYALAVSKLTQLLEPYVHGDQSNVAHMEAFLNHVRDSASASSAAAATSVHSVYNIPSAFDDQTVRVLAAYDECMLFQHQLNIVQNVIRRIRSAQRQLPAGKPAASAASAAAGPPLPTHDEVPDAVATALGGSSGDKLRVLGECALEVLMHYVTEYKDQAVGDMHALFDRATCERLFHTLVVAGDVHQQLTVCALLAQMGAGQEWFGAFVADTFTQLFSSQNMEVFPADRVFYLMSYLGKKSMAVPMAGASRPISLLDDIMRALATELVPLARQQRRANGMDVEVAPDENEDEEGTQCADHQLISWLLLYLSVCLDDGNASAHMVVSNGPENGGGGVKQRSQSELYAAAAAGCNGAKQRTQSELNATAAAGCNSASSRTVSDLRWEFMSGDADLSRARAGAQAASSNGRPFSRSFKKRLLQAKTPATASAVANNFGKHGECISGFGVSGFSKADKVVQVAQLNSQIEAALKQQEHMMKKHTTKLQQLQTCLEKTKKKKIALHGEGGSSSGSSSSNISHHSNTTTGTSSGSGSSAETLVGVERPPNSDGTNATATAAAASAALGSDGEQQQLQFGHGVPPAKITNTVLVIRGLFGLVLSLDYTCSMDLFLLTCKVSWYLL